MTLAKDRAAKGLCPHCGELAAPYYLCDRCNRRSQIRRFMHAMQKQGAVRICPSGRAYQLANDIDINRLSYAGLAPGQRAAPRIRGIPAEVERELMQILARESDSMSLEQITEAWAKLRRKPGQTSAASGMAALIKASDKRERKMKRNAW